MQVASDQGVCIGYSTIETKEAARIGYNGFLFRMSTGKFFCFNNNVSNLYNNSVVVKIIGMAYIFTFLMFRKR